MCTHKRWVRNKYTGKYIFVKCGKCEACLQEKAALRAQRIRNNCDFIYGKDLVCFFVTLSFENMFIPYIYRSHVEMFRKNEIDEIPVFRDYSIRSVRAKGRKWKSKYIKNELPIMSLTEEDFVTKSHFEPVLNTKGIQPEEQGEVFHFDYSKVKPNIDLLYEEEATIRVHDNYFDFTDALKNAKGLVLSHHGDNIIYDTDKVSVALYSDIQLFFKRFRQNLKRNFGISSKCSYVAITEYGETTQRAHIHLLLFFSKDFLFEDRLHSSQYIETFQKQGFTPYSTIKRAIIKSWPYGRFRGNEQVQIARNPAAYVSSYVCGNMSLPKLLGQSPIFKPKFHTSQDFGNKLASLRLEAVVEAFDKGDLHYHSKHIKSKQLIDRFVPFPQYVVNRYFPRFKGFSRLTDNEIYDVAECPANIYRYAQKAQLDFIECDKIITLLTHKKDYYEREFWQKSKPYPFAYVYSRIWSMYNSQQIIDHYKQEYNTDAFLQYYDNLPDYLKKRNGAMIVTYEIPLKHDVVDDVICLTRDAILVQLDNANLFPNNVASTDNMTYWYSVYDKTRKVTNKAITQLQNQF